MPHKTRFKCYFRFTDAIVRAVGIAPSTALNVINRPTDLTFLALSFECTKICLMVLCGLKHTFILCLLNTRLETSEVPLTYGIMTDPLKTDQSDFGLRFSLLVCVSLSWNPCLWPTPDSDTALTPYSQVAVLSLTHWGLMLLPLPVGV